MFEHRNYLPSLGILLCLAYFLVTVDKAAVVRGSAVGLFLVALLASTWVRASAWGDHASFTQWQVRNHPDSPRANYGLGILLLGQLRGPIDPNRPNVSKALAAFDRATALNPDYTEGLFAIVTVYSAAGLSVPADRFEELLYRLENRGFHVQSINHIKALYRCYLARGCKISPVALRQIRDATARTPGFPESMAVHLPKG